MINPYENLPIDWRFEKIFHLKSICASDGMPEDLQEFLEEDFDPLQKDNAKILFSLPFLSDAFDEDGELYHEEVFQDLFAENPTDGFIILIQTKIPRYMSGKSFHSSWGYCQLTWIYAKSIEEAEKTAFSISKLIHAEEKKKAKKK